MPEVETKVIRDFASWKPSGLNTIMPHKGLQGVQPRSPGAKSHLEIYLFPFESKRAEELTEEEVLTGFESMLGQSFSDMEVIMEANVLSFKGKRTQGRISVFKRAPDWQLPEDLVTPNSKRTRPFFEIQIIESPL